MNVFWTTLKRELMSYLFSPTGYLIAVLLYLFRGFEIGAWAKRTVYLGSNVDDFVFSYLSSSSSLIMIAFVPPILTMRCFAEERRTGSIEVLLTAPVRSWEVVLGKFGAAFVFFNILWWPTLVLLWVLSGDAFLGVDLAFGPVLSSYLGLILIGSLILAAGCFVSSLTDNLLLATLGGILFSLGLMALPGLLLPSVALLSEDYPFVVTLFSQIHVMDHLQSWFSRGLIDTGRCAFYVTGVAFFLFLTTISLEARRWR